MRAAAPWRGGRDHLRQWRVALARLALLLALAVCGLSRPAGVPAVLAVEQPPVCAPGVEDTLAGIPPLVLPPGLQPDERWDCVMTHADLGELIVSPAGLDVRDCRPPAGEPLPGGYSVDSICGEVAFGFAPKLPQCLSDTETACYEHFVWVVPAPNVRFVPNYWFPVRDRGPLMLWRWVGPGDAGGPCTRQSSLCMVEALRLVTLAQWRGQYPSDAWVETAAVVMSYRDGLGTPREAWFSVPLHVIGPNKPPSADFVYEATGAPGEIRFTSTSTDPEGDLLQLEWDFGDGETGAGAEVTHAYSSTGSQDVTLSVTDASGNSDQRSRTIDVEGPLAVIDVETFPGDPLVVSLSGQHSVPSTGADIVDWSWNLGDGTTDNGFLILHNYPAECIYPVSLTITDDIGAQATAEKKVTVGDPPVPAFTWTQLPDDRFTVDFDASSSTGNELTYDWDFGDGTVEPDAGPFPWHTFPDLGPWTVTLTITDLDGCALDEQQVVELGKPLVVTVTPDPAEFKLNEGPAENEFPVTVAVENISAEPIDAVMVTGGHKPLVMTSLAADPEVALELVDPLPSAELGTIWPGKTKSKSVIYQLRAFDRVHAKLKALVTGDKGGETVTGLGVGEVKVTRDVLIEVRLRLLERPFWLSGQTVRLEGTVKNVSEDKTLGVVAFPITEGNAGSGVLFVDRGGRTPEGPEGWVLGAGDEIQVRGLLPTARAFFASDAKVHYVVRAWVHEDDGTKTNADDQVEIVEDSEEGYASSFSVRLLPDPPPTDDELTGQCGTWYFTCGVVTGVGDLALGTWDLLRLVGTSVWDLGNYGYRYTAWVGQMYGEMSLVLEGDELARQRLADEIALDLQSLVDAGAITLGQGQDLGSAVGRMTVDTVDKWARVYHDGDLETVLFEGGRLLGSNPDAALETVVAARLAWKMGKQVRGGATAMREALERAAEAQRASLAERIAAAEERGVPLSKSGAFAAGDELTFDVIRRAWGASKQNMLDLLAIAKDENVIIAFRSRAAEAIELLKNDLAWPKPELMKIKSTNQIDIDFLGYRPAKKGVVELVEPPVDWRLTGQELEDALDAHMDVLKQRHPEQLADPDRFAEVRARLKTRTEEFPVYTKLLKKWQERGIEVGFRPGEQGIGEDIARGVQDKRAVNVKELDAADVPDPSRKYFAIEMGGPNGGELRPVTGDLDFMAILNPDGTMILDQEKRIRIYQHLQRLLGMQHGETFTYAGEARAAWLRPAAEGGEALVVVSPDGSMRAAYFVENKSIVPGSVNAALRKADRTGDFILLAGAKYELRTQLGLFERLVLPSLSEAMVRFFSRRLYFLPGYLHRFIDGLSDNQVPPQFERSPGAVVIQPDGEGGLRLWTEEEGWRPITLGEALDLGGPDVLDLLPQTSLSNDAPAGSKRLEVTSPKELGMSADTPWFEPGDVVVIDPGGPNEAFGTVAALGSIILEEPLAADHAKGEMVTIAELAGCGEDSDSDGTPDCADGCLDDAAKIEPGVCGCGVPDQDLDGDGQVDCPVSGTTTSTTSTTSSTRTTTTGGVGSTTMTTTTLTTTTTSTTTTTTLGIDHFTGYGAREWDKSDKLPKDCNVTLDDPLFDGAENFTILAIKGLYLPADKNGEGIADPVTHLLAYKIKPAGQGIGAPAGSPGREKFPRAAKHAKRAGVVVENQFGNLILDTMREDLLLVPSQKGLTAPPEPELPGSTLDHYKCYKVKPAKGAKSDQTPEGKFSKDIEVTVEDQFMDGLIDRCAQNSPRNAGKLCRREQTCGGESGVTTFCDTVPHPILGTARVYDLKKPVHLCNPVSKTNIDTTEQDGKGRTRATGCAVAPAAIENPAVSLVCYRVQRTTKVLDPTIATRVGLPVGAKIEPKQSKHRARTPFVLNQLPNPARVQTKAELELCVPSTIQDAGALQ